MAKKYEVWQHRAENRRQAFDRASVSGTRSLQVAVFEVMAYLEAQVKTAVLRRGDQPDKAEEDFIEACVDFRKDVETYLYG